MNETNEEKINCQLLNLSNQNVLNCLEYIAFDSNSTIVLAIQQQIINCYFFKNNYLKHMSSIKVLKDEVGYLNQLEYLKTSNSILTIYQQRILIANLNGFNTRKFLLKNRLKLQGRCGSLLFNKIQSHLFISNQNQICFFEKRMDGWKCSQEIEVDYSRVSVISMCLNCQEDELLVQTNNGYTGSTKVYIYHKKTQQQEIKWIQIQSMWQGIIFGKLWGGFVDHFYLINEFALNVYNKSNQSQDYIHYASSEFKHSQSLIFKQILQNNLVLLIKNQSISVMKLNQQQKLEQIKQIKIDLSALNNLNHGYSSKQSLLTQDEKLLVIWNRQDTLIIEMIYI
ncbi:unnamed protein product (macronuclear) [Paramecium tetraurelia]|uniref:CNH domain-containing protein n=1 Tax=Paramecium tetraurelia TaxID=5888 RepID=A0E0E9_PARTE|nr:uncharacterized protein GSPATT00021934001 [Paramecium tetraurelia]CAK88766.1 unnamed protein product [Paramecium tetraurelia]|eukprot:XP_001456163.1 hypothetical protein (macronuclear) [Paramecium tetraurelia strain d4-2]